MARTSRRGFAVALLAALGVFAYGRESDSLYGAPVTETTDDGWGAGTYGGGSWA